MNREYSQVPEKVNSKKNPKNITTQTKAKLAYLFGYRNRKPLSMRVGKSVSYFVGHYFEGVIARMFGGVRIDEFSKNPDVLTEYKGKKIFLEVKSTSIDNGIVFRPLQLERLLRNNSTSEIYCVMVFHDCRNLSENFKNKKENIVKDLKIRGIYIIPVKDFFDMWIRGDFDHKKLLTDTRKEPFVVLLEGLVKKIFNSYSESQKVSLGRITSIGLDLNEFDIDLEKFNFLS